MGSSSSKDSKQPTDHGPLPPELIPFPGPQVQHLVVELKVKLRAHVSFGSCRITASVDEHYSTLGVQYGEGFTLISFYRIPFASQQTGLFSRTLAVPYQGIFSRCPSPSTHECWQLRIEKSTMHIQTMTSVRFFRSPSIQSSANTSHLVEIVSKCSAAGGRLICLEMTDIRLTSGKRGLASSSVDADVGVDLFFNMPLHPEPTMYIYLCVHTPIPVTVTLGFGMAKVDIQFNFMAHLAAHLNQGYRLVEIFYDQSAISRLQGFVMPTTDMTMNAIWFFEKEAKQAEDSTPLYEGCIVEYYMKLKGGFAKVTASANWGHLLETMGNRGWELACTLETPKVTRAGMRTAKQTILLFFQRKLSNSEMPSF